MAWPFRAKSLSLRAKQLRDRARETQRLHAQRLTGMPARLEPDLQELTELLGREPVNLDTPELQRFLAGRRVLVTGAGGSIGSELCRQAARYTPERLVLVERSEAALFDIDRQLRERWIGLDLHPTVCDITDTPRLRSVFDAHRPDVVFHAAAHKHVPMMELNPGEAIKNNVLGTRNLVDVCLEHRVDSLVLISTDKAVHPTSVMGATKRLAEMIVQTVPPNAGRYLAVRFGNVIGSSGSVVPIFRQQIASGGPVTVTHPEMRRYFMTIPEATQLVMQAGAIGGGGEVFLLDMGEPVRIMELAETMIRRAGLTVGRDIDIRITGPRPGEKLFEELTSSEQHTRPTSHPKISVWDLPPTTSAQVKEAVDALAGVINAPAPIAIAALRQTLPEYHPEFACVPSKDDRHTRASVVAARETGPTIESVATARPAPALEAA
jgi:FlaA1/EpsC-like NDP-sugar epimerase